MKFLEKWKPIDIISLVLVVGCLGLLYLGKDGIIKITLLAVVTVYYGVDLAPFIRLGRRTRRKQED